MTLRRTSITWLILVIAIMVGTVSASAKTKVTVWLTISTTDAVDHIKGVIERFQAENPNIEVELVPVNGYYEPFDKLLVSLAGGAAPNLALIEQSLAYTLVSANGAVDLTDYIEKEPGMSLKDYDPALRATVTFNNRMYGIPYNVSTPVFFYNKDIFLQSGLQAVAPRTKEELLNVAKRTTRQGSDGKIERYGFYLTAWRWLFEAWIGRSGSDLIAPDLSKFTFDSPKAQDILQFAQDLVHSYRVAGYGSSASAAHKPFFAGQLAMMEYSTAGLDAIEDTTSQNGIELGVAPLPCYERCYVPVGGANWMMVNTGTAAEKDATWKFLASLVSPENLASFAITTGYMAARRSARGTSIYQAFIRKDPNAMVTYNQIDYAHSRPQVPFWNTLQSDLINRLSPAMYSKNDNFRPVLFDIANKANALLKEWKEKK